MSKALNIPSKSKGKLSPRPYARLLTMIGDQLIKNEKIALFELIKNSYDADADWVQVRLVNFEEVKDDTDELIEIKIKPNSFIEIEDDGNGMEWSILSDAWMNPASPSKLLDKRKGKRKSERKKRLIQGEKGIGRYAAFKVGSTLEIFTKSIEKNSKEIYLKTDLSKYDEETFEIKGKLGEKVQFLDEVEYDYEINNPAKHILEKNILIQNSRRKRNPYGTLIRITNLKQGGLTLKRIDEIIDDVNKLGSPFSEENISKDFTFDLLINNNSRYHKDEFRNRLESLFEKAPLRITEGSFDENFKFHFKQNNKKIDLSLDRVKEIKSFRERFCDKNNRQVFRKPECGPFSFQFYIFDLSKDAAPKYLIDINEKQNDDRDFIKKHRIYLYRDGIRVYPYGDPSDDWVKLDMKRGTLRAGDFLSNDQVIGYIGISDELNPNLKDKTNREGLLEIGNAYEDFIAIIQTLFGYFHTEFTKYRSDISEKSIRQKVKDDTIPNQLNIFSDYLSDKIDEKKKKEFQKIVYDYKAERKYLKEKIETTEDLAAVGLTVEAASHDLMTMIQRSKETMDFLIKMSNSKNLDQDKLTENIEKLRGEITFIEDQIKGIQPVFRSSRRRRKDFRITNIIGTVRKYYEVLMHNYKIELNIEEIGPPLVIKTNEAVLLQLFINLFDNSVYWLSSVDIKNKKILIKIDGNKYEVSFADNGPGISSDDEPYIFEPFFSTKGEKGRGLGLYIAKQLLERNEFSITYEKSKKILSGANFKMDFSSIEEE